MNGFEEELAELIVKWRALGAALDDIATDLEIARYSIQEEIDAERAE